MKHKKVSAAVVVALASAAACGSAVADTNTTWQPYLGLDLMWLDNLNLAGDGEPKQEDYIGQVAPGLRLTHKGPRLGAYLDYRMQALFYEEQDDLNEVIHNAALSAAITAVENWLFVDLDGSYFQSLVDPRQPANTDNIFGVGNTSDTAAGKVTPRLQHRFGDAQLVASYAVGFVDYRDSGNSSQVVLDDSRNEEGLAELSSTNEQALVTWRAHYEYQHAEYDIAQPFKYERALAELGLRVAPDLRLIGNGGLESDPFDLTADGGLEESFWAAGFDWNRGKSFELRVLGGERFFGTSWEALLRTKGRVLALELGYDQTPTTQTQTVALRDVQAPDPALPVEPVPPEAAVFGRATSEVYLLKRAYATLSAVGRLTRVGLDVSAEKREYVQLAGLEDEFRTGRVFVNRRFGPRVSAELSASIIDADLREGGSYRDTLYDLQVQRQIGTSTTVSLTGHHLSRSGDLEEYDANWVSLGLQMTF